MSKVAINKRVQQRKKAHKKLEREHIKKHGNVLMNPKVKPMWAPRQEQRPAPTTFTHDVAPTRRTLRDVFGW